MNCDLCSQGAGGGGRHVPNPLTLGIRKVVSLRKRKYFSQMFSLEYILQALHSPAGKHFIFHKLGCLEPLKSLREALVSRAAWGFQTVNILLTKTSPHYSLCYSQPVTVLAITKPILKLQCPSEVIFKHHLMQTVDLLY